MRRRKRIAGCMYKALRLSKNRIFASRITWYVLVASAMLCLGVLWVGRGYHELSDAQRGFLLLVVFSALLVVELTERVGRSTAAPAWQTSLPVAIITFSLLAALILFFRGYYSRGVYFASFFASVTVATLRLGFVRKTGCQIYGVLQPQKSLAKLFRSRSSQIKIITDHSQLDEQIDALIVDLRMISHEPRWVKCVARYVSAGIAVLSADDVYEQIYGRVRVGEFLEEQARAFSVHPIYLWVKQILESSLIVITAPLWLPVFLFTALIVLVTMGRPVFFSQWRIGMNGRPFKLYKFRSMKAAGKGARAKFADDEDERITPFGRVMRRYRLDEIPQFFNVLKGDMSMIGPRPEQPEFVNQFRESILGYHYRHTVRPGITGWAQVNQGYASNETGARIKLEYDLFYIKRYSLLMDIQVLFRTIATMLTGFGAK